MTQKSEALIGLFSAALLGALAFFYGSQIWQSSECSRDAIAGCHQHRARLYLKQIYPQEKADDRIADYTLWLAILTGALVVASGIQMYFITRADRIATRASNATQSLAVATAESVGLARENAERELRAYIFLENAFFKRSGIDTWSISYRLKNFGKTPAHKVEVTDIVRVVDWAKEETLVPNPTSPPMSFGSMAPGVIFLIMMHCLMGVVILQI
jgi:hypothetical protein